MTPNYPQANGQVEASKKNIIKSLQKFVGESQRDWYYKLPYALWAYRTSIRNFVRETSFSLISSEEAIVSLEL